MFWPWHYYYFSVSITHLLYQSVLVLVYKSQTQLSYHEPVTAQLNLIKAPIWEWCAAMCHAVCEQLGLVVQKGFKLFLRRKHLLKCHYLDTIDYIVCTEERSGANHKHQVYSVHLSFRYSKWHFFHVFNIKCGNFTKLLREHMRVGCINIVMNVSTVYCLTFPRHVAWPSFVQIHRNSF